MNLLQRKLLQLLTCCLFFLLLFSLPANSAADNNAAWEFTWLPMPGSPVWMERCRRCPGWAVIRAFLAILMYDCHIKPQLNNNFSEVDFFCANLNKISLPGKLNSL